MCIPNNSDGVSSFVIVELMQNQQQEKQKKERKRQNRSLGTPKEMQYRQKEHGLQNITYREKKWIMTRMEEERVIV